MATNEERISALEAFRVTDAMDVKELQDTVERIDKNVQQIHAQMSRQQGFIAGAMFVITPILALVMMGVKEMWARFTGK